MDLPSPKRKKFADFKTKYDPLPMIPTIDGTFRKFSGHFNGYTVVINDLEEMKLLNTMGTFGKGNLSRNFPSYEQENEPVILRNRQFSQHKKYSDKKQKPAKVLVVPDSDSEADEYFIDLKPKYEIDRSGLKETVNLLLEEAYFLCKEISCLNIYDGNHFLTSNQVWDLFVSTDPNFIENYIVYFYYRSKNWVVKPGIKFGGDYVLYKEGPHKYHSTYVVIIDVLDENFVRKMERRRSMNIQDLLALHRLCGTAGKELLLCQIIWPKNTNTSNSNFVSNLSIKEVLMKRWLGCKEDD